MTNIRVTQNASSDPFTAQESEEESHEQSEMYAHLNNKFQAPKAKARFSPPLKVNNAKARDLEETCKLETAVKKENVKITYDNQDLLKGQYPTFKESDSGSTGRNTQMNETSKTFTIGEDRESQLLIKKEQR